MFLTVITLSVDPSTSNIVTFACKRKLIENCLAVGLKIVTTYLDLNRAEKQLAWSRRLKTSRIEVTSIGTFSTLRQCAISARKLHRRFYGAPGWAC